MGTDLILFPEKPISQISEWVLIGGFISAAQDIDIYLILIFKSINNNRLKPFRSLIRIHQEFNSFMTTAKKTGVLKTAMKSHFIILFIVLFFFYFYKSSYFLPVIIGMLSHILTDIPNIKNYENLSK